MRSSIRLQGALQLPADGCPADLPALGRGAGLGEGLRLGGGDL
jgi:hypothetical protein